MIWSIASPEDATIQTFAKNLGCTWIGNVQVQSSGFSVENCCHNNVDVMVSCLGGERMVGYYFVKFDSYCQAILHSVWRDPCGHLIDVTPYADERDFNCFAISGANATLNRNVYYSTDGPVLAMDERSFYVYLLIDPRSKLPFYVGKGTGRRAQQHLWSVTREQNRFKSNLIASIRRAGLEPEIVYVAENIYDEELAYDMEAALIRKWGRKGYDPEGILTNVCSDSRPPSHRGKTYEEIYGPERAREQIEKRTRLQRERGGYGPKQHSEKTCALFRITNGGERNGRYGKEVSEATRRAIGAANSRRRGKDRASSLHYVLTNSEGEAFDLFGLSEVKAFCDARGLSFATFTSGLRKGWPPSTRGKNVGWVFVRVGEEAPTPKRWSITFPDGRIQEEYGHLKAVCARLGISYEVIRKSLGALLTKGSLKGFRVELL